jgi:hypothetical protein
MRQFPSIARQAVQLIENPIQFAQQSLLLHLPGDELALGAGYFAPLSLELRDQVAAQDDFDLCRFRLCANRGDPLQKQ